MTIRGDYPVLHIHTYLHSVIDLSCLIVGTCRASIINRKPKEATMGKQFPVPMEGWPRFRPRRHHRQQVLAISHKWTDNMTQDIPSEAMRQTLGRVFLSISPALSFCAPQTFACRGDPVIHPGMEPFSSYLRSSRRPGLHGDRRGPVAVASSR
jgi:hypothetical protein